MRTVLFCFAVSIAVSARAETFVLDFDDLSPDALIGDAAVRAIGPTSEHFKNLPDSNLALRLDGDGDYVRVPDNSEYGSLDFRQGDPISIEAWVRLDRISAGQNVYLVGKGRTHQGKQRENQNYALRLRGVGKEACASFLFRSAADDDHESDWHRWTSQRGFRCDGYWHHVAITYQFGIPDSIRGYVDGKPMDGKWDMGGPTERAPVVDDDDLWIGSSMGGSAGTSLAGAIDAVAIRREILAADAFVDRRVMIVHPPQIPSGGLPRGVVSVSIEETDGGNAAWPIRSDDALARYQQSAFAIARIPAPYGTGGVRRDRHGAVRLVAMAEVQLPAGASEWMLRAGGLSRLWIGETIVAETPAHLGYTNGHGEVLPYPDDDPWIRPIRMGHHQEVATHEAAAGKTLVTLETMIGGDGLRCEPGEIVVAFRFDSADPWQILSPTEPIPLTDEGWRRYAVEHEAVVQQVEDQQRRLSASAEDPFWSRRHERARDFVAALPQPKWLGSDPSNTVSPIDQIIYRRIEDAGRQADVTPLTTDSAFLRRLHLDCVGVVPTLQEIDAFAAMEGDPSDGRSEMIDRVLADPRWADHWTSYWMDVLAENASMLKPSLNNTGPFRWYLHDMLRDNVAIDRWVTELIRMRGSELFGGAAGFAMAADNDVPMAAKAHVTVSAFLGANMKCARCHDAPYHDWTQEDLFSLAAMLERDSIAVPKSSSVPPEFFEGDEAGASLITLSLSPGQAVQPTWPLAGYTTDLPVDPQHVADPSDPREMLAYHITRVENRQFAKTIVNRLWERLMGEGIVQPVDDWEGARASHPELLDYLSRELAASGFDIQHVVRLILNSQAYQRRCVDRAVEHDESSRLFAAPRARRMTAEQLVDSMHVVVGRAMNADELTFDPEARMKPAAQNNLGSPRRAWQLTSLSNERDRPALTLPRSAAVAECLEAFGWTGSRQEPINHRQTDSNVIQPGILANGMLSVQLTRLTDSDSLTALAREAESVSVLVDRLFERFLTRAPSESERERFVRLLEDGFETRVRTFAAPAETPVREPLISWANHLHPEATEVRLRQSARLRLGPSPSRWLEDDWRERLEDAAWAMINAPEFQFLP